jgi:hypothetical protein
LYKDIDVKENPIVHVLTCALEESRAGHDACHVRNVIKKLSQHTYCSTKSKWSFSGIISEWVECGSLLLERIKFDCEQQSESWRIELDWELLRLMLKEWTRGSKCTLLVTSTVQNENEIGAVVEFQLHLLKETPISKRISKTEQRLANELNGKFVTPVLFVISVQTLRDDPTSTKVRANDEAFFIHSLEERSVSPSDIGSFPPNLCFAVLDDNSLVRKNTERLVSKYLKSRTSSFVRGVNFAECTRFPQEVMDQKVDIVIYDLNLEFEDGGIQGTRLAEQARERGFLGCQILYSADTEILISLNDKVFDGLVEKTADRTILLAGIKRAWGNHLRKRHLDEEG